MLISDLFCIYACWWTHGLLHGCHIRARAQLTAADRRLTAKLLITQAVKGSIVCRAALETATAGILLAQLCKVGCVWAKEWIAFQLGTSAYTPNPQRLPANEAIKSKPGPVNIVLGLKHFSKLLLIKPPVVLLIKQRLAFGSFGLKYFQEA